MRSIHLYAICLLLHGVQPFLAPASQSALRRHTDSRYMNADDDDTSPDDMRRMLEASWNADLMGNVPTSAERAAGAVIESLNKARAEGKKNVYMVNILLPQYDITQGKNLYDEVLATEFCISMSRRLDGKSEIVLKDAKSVDTVNRMLRLREGESTSFDDTADDSDDEDEDEEEKEAELSPTEDGIEFYDDFADFGVIESIARPTEEPVAKPSKDPPKPKSPTVSAPVAAPEKKYRITSMLGDLQLTSRGPDMMDKVLKALSANAKPLDDEKTVIVLSAASPEESIGVRALINTYQSSKRIILVNCKLEPFPRELIGAEVIYSLLPLIARAADTDNNLFTKKANPDVIEPRIVVMRRYPSDWQVFVDVGSGFDLAASVPVDQVDRNGPSTSWVAGVVKDYLQANSA